MTSIPPHSNADATSTGRNATTLGIILTLVSMLGFASMDAVSKVLGQTLPIPQILWVRYVIFSLLAIALLRHLGLRKVAQSGQPLLQAARALLIVVENGLFVLAFTYLPLADVHAIAAVSPLIVVALSVPLLGEKVGLRRWLAVAAGFAGVLLIVRPGFQVIDWPIAIALGAAVLWGVYQLLVRLCSRTDSSETTWLWTALVGLVATTAVGPFYWRWPDAQGWSLLVAIALLGSAAHWALIRALGLAEASVLQPFSYGLLFFAALIGFLAFGDSPDAWTSTGALVIIASGLYAWHRERWRTDP